MTRTNQTNEPTTSHAPSAHAAAWVVIALVAGLGAIYILVPSALMTPLGILVFHGLVPVELIHLIFAPLDALAATWPSYSDHLDRQKYYASEAMLRMIGGP